jgi:hypothetical protein
MMRKLSSRTSFSGLILLVFALLLPALASAAPQAASPQSATQKSLRAPSSKRATHPVMFVRGKNSKVTPKPLAKVTPEQDGDGGLTPPDWYEDSNEIPKQIVGATETPFPMIITNEGDTTITVTDISGDNPEFTFGGDCTAANGIAAGASCTLQITYSPTAPCSTSGEDVDSVDITFTDNDPNGNLALSLIAYGAASGGITTDDLRDTSLTPASIAQSLVGPGITISNVTYTGVPWAVGTFNGGNGIIGFNSGIILSNGAVSNVIGPNCSPGITQSNATPGDTDLTNLIGGTNTNDAAILEFDFVPTNPTITFQYVWASDEYQDFVFDYNDVFAFFLGQPGNATDIALIPGTNTIVSINNVNNGSTDPGNFNIPPVNPQFYVNNDFQYPTVAPYNTEMDGMTVVLTATANVTPGQTNHIKLAVADAIDTVYDSNVFIRGGSLVSSVLSPSPTGLAFGNVDINATSAPQTVTITNVGSAPLTSLAITTSNNAFAQTNNCGTSLAAGASCTVTVTFTSATAGLVQGNIQIADNAPDSPQLISISGTAISGPYASFSPTSLTFGPQAQGTSSQPQTVTLTNIGTAPLDVNQVQLLSTLSDETSEFTISNDLCSDSSVAPKATCTVAVTYTPNTSSEPPDVDALVVTDNGQNQGQQTVGLNGGVSISVNLAPANVAFGNQKVNTTSAVQTITVTNPVSNTGTVTIASVIVTSGFAETNNCTSTQFLAPGSSCTINVAFSPTVAQAYTGFITITDSAPGSPQMIPLTGTGTSGNTTLTVTPTSLTFGSQQVGTTGEPQTVTVSNPGPAAVTFTNIVSSANWTIGTGDGAGTCTSTGNLAASASCTINVAFSPAASGPLTGSLTVTYNVAGGSTGQTAAAQLSGTGTASVGTITVSPTSLSFGSQVVNTTSAAQAITVTNTGTTSVTISSVTAPGGFAQTNNCTTLAASATCTINVTFTPAAAQAYSGNVTITDTATGSPQTVAVSGTGLNSPVIITIPSGGSNTATSVPGGTAYYGLIITAAPGFTGTVQLGCTVSSPTITCTPVPSSITISGTGTTEVAFAIQTYCKGTTTNSPGSGSVPALPTLPRGPGGLALLIVTLSLAGASWTFRRNPRAAIAFALVLIVILGGAACSGGPAKGPNGITPAGTYFITLSATTSSGTVSMPNFLKLVVN